MDQLKKRKAETAEVEEEKKPKEKKQKTLTEWSATELDKDESKNLQNALKEILKSGVSKHFRAEKSRTVMLIQNSFYCIEIIKVEGCS